MQSHSNKIIEFYNKFDGKNLDSLNQFYSSEVDFQDPVTQIKGLNKLKAYYSHAYKNVKEIKFIFSDIMQDNQKYSAPWVMHLAVKGLNGGKKYFVHGISVLHFNEHGLVEYHRDYLDLGEMVYERIPVQGYLIHKIKKMLLG